MRLRAFCYFGGNFNLVEKWVRKAGLIVLKEGL
jgi:hypothetical protein